MESNTEIDEKNNKDLNTEKFSKHKYSKKLNEKVSDPYHLGII